MIHRHELSQLLISDFAPEYANMLLSYYKRFSDEEFNIRFFGGVYKCLGYGRFY